MLGIIIVNRNPYLALVTESIKVAHFVKSNIYQIKTVEFISFEDISLEFIKN
jgi:hypothetical protein